MLELINITSPIGNITVFCENSQIIHVTLDGISEIISQSQGINDLLLDAKTQLGEYFEGKRKQFALPLNLKQIKGFQNEVLEIASRIPFGETLTYGQIAGLLHNSKASRAVGASLAHNPLPLFIPCHRVLAADGRLTGYLGQKGIAAKKWLLELEGHKIVGEKLV
jgi:methylated-DNA-[protein]-cysteine S-methyltransferase